jgi:hypothetical protein
MATVASNYRVVIGGLVRNSEKYLPSCLTWIRTAYTYFHPSSKLLFITNDSNDRTPEILAEFATTYPDGSVKIYNLDGLAAKKPARADRLAFCRNLFLNHVHANYSDYDFMILIDLDDITANFDPRRLLSCFDASQTPTQWDVLTASAAPEYYDIWALRSSIIGLTHDVWDAVRHERLKGVPYEQAVQKCVQKWRIPYTLMTDPIEVESAFGGLGVYRISATRGCKYTGIPTTCSLGEPSSNCLREICEHVPFHQQMRELNGARIWIYPPLYVTPM